jgi:polysaccharide biosynthesis protein VpsM
MSLSPRATLRASGPDPPRIRVALACSFFIHLACGEFAHAQTVVEKSAIRSLDTRFSEEIGVRQPSIYEPDTSTALNPGSVVESEQERGFFARVKVSREYVDNILQSQGRGVGDERWLVRPSLGYETAIGRHRMQITFDGRVITYDTLNSENTLGNRTRLQTDWNVSKLFKGRSSFTYENGHDARGAENTRLAQAAQPDIWRSVSTGLTLTYGRRIATAQLEGSIETSALRYQNNGQEVRDLDQYTFGTKGYYNFGPRLSTYIETTRTFFDYRHPSSILGGEQWGGFLGVRWEATAKTTGEIKYGREKRRFTDSNQKSSWGDSWDVKVNWEPELRSKVQIFASSSAGESTAGNGTGGSQVNSRYGLTWVYGFSDRLRTNNRFTYSVSEYGGGREDQTFSMQNSVAYEFEKGLELIGEVRRNSRESTNLAAGFKDNIYSIQLNAKYPEILGF